MKHIKEFENIQETPQIGDYVLCQETLNDNTDVHNFLSNNIGKIIKISEANTDDYWPGKSIFRTHLVEFNTEPNRNRTYMDFTRKNKNMNTTYFKSFNKKQIVAFGKTINEVELKLAQKKYNI